MTGSSINRLAESPDILDSPMNAPLDGVSVLVAGAGLAGLTAARDLVRVGANVTVVEARSRLGGRVTMSEDRS